MAYIRLPLGVRVAMEYEVFGKIVVNVYHVTCTDPIITAKLFDITDIFIDWWDSYTSIGLSPDIALVNVTALNLNVENGEKIENVVSPPLPGTAVGGANPNNVALVATLNTSQTGRSFRGRSYQAGLREADVTGNNTTTTITAWVVANYVALRTALVADNCLLTVASFVSGGLPRSEGIATTVDSVSCNTRIDTQRRRLPVA